MPIVDYHIVIIDFFDLIPITSYRDKYNRKYLEPTWKGRISYGLNKVQVLRNSYISFLANSSTSAKVIQKLARHSDPRLILKRPNKKQ